MVFTASGRRLGTFYVPGLMPRRDKPAQTQGALPMKSAPLDLPCNLNNKVILVPVNVCPKKKLLTNRTGTIVRSFLMTGTVSIQRSTPFTLAVLLPDGKSDLQGRPSLW